MNIFKIIILALVVVVSTSLSVLANGSIRTATPILPEDTKHTAPGKNHGTLNLQDNKQRPQDDSSDDESWQRDIKLMLCDPSLGQYHVVDVKIRDGEKQVLKVNTIKITDAVILRILAEFLSPRDELSLASTCNHLWQLLGSDAIRQVAIEKAKLPLYRNALTAMLSANLTTTEIDARLHSLSTTSLVKLSHTLKNMNRLDSKRNEHRVLLNTNTNSNPRYYYCHCDCSELLYTLLYCIGSAPGWVALVLGITEHKSSLFCIGASILSLTCPPLICSTNNLITYCYTKRRVATSNAQQQRFLDENPFVIIMTDSKETKENKNTDDKTYDAPLSINEDGE